MELLRAPLTGAPFPSGVGFRRMKSRTEAASIAYDHLRHFMETVAFHDLDRRSQAVQDSRCPLDSRVVPAPAGGLA